MNELNERNPKVWIASFLKLVTTSLLLFGMNDSCCPAEPIELRPAAECRGHVGPVLSVAFSSDSTAIFSGGADKTIRQWSLEGIASKTILKEHTDRINSIALSRNGKQLVSGSDDMTIRVWDLVTGKSKHLIEPKSKIMSVAFADSGKMVVAGCLDDKLLTWKLNGSNYESDWVLSCGKISTLAVLPDESRCCFSTGGPGFKLADLAKRGFAPGGYAMTTMVPITSCTTSFNGEIVATCQKDGVVRIWRTLPCETIRGRFFPPSDAIMCQPSSNGSHLFIVIPSDVTGAESSIMVWNVVSDKITAQLLGAPSRCHAVALTANDSHFSVAGDDGRIIIWKLDSLTEQMKEDIGPLVAMTAKVNEAARDVIQVGDWPIVPVGESKLPYLKDAGAFILFGAAQSLGFSFSTKKDLPVFLVVDMTYKGKPGEQQMYERSYRQQLAQANWVELGRCPWNPSATVHVHANEAAGEKSFPILGEAYPKVPQVVFSSAPMSISAAQREKLPAETQQKLLAYDVGRLGEKKSWDDLETMAKTFRNQNRMFANGESVLWVFYTSLFSKKQPQTIKAKEDFFNTWIKAKPNSATPKLGLAYARINSGWSARGEDLTIRVTVESAAELEKQMMQAQKLAKDCEKLEPKDPMIDWCNAECLRGLGGDVKTIREIGMKGLKKSPLFRPLIDSVVYSLLPRWYGKVEDAESFAKALKIQSKGRDWIAQYALAARALMSIEPGRWNSTFKFDRQSVVDGLAAYHNRFPESNWPRNLTCLITFQEGDHQLARKMFSEIEMSVDEEIWHGLPSFEECRDAVQEQNPDRLLYRRRVHHVAGIGMALSGDGKTVVTCGRDPEVCISDVASGKEIATGYLSDESFAYIALRMNGDVVAKKGEEVIRWKPSESNYKSLEWKSPAVSATFDFSPDATSMVVAPNNGEVKLLVYSAETGKPLFQIASPNGLLRTYYPSLSFSHNGKRLFHSDSTSIVTVFDMMRGKILATLESGNQGRILTVATFNDGKNAGAVEANRILEWDVETRKIIWSQATNENFGNKLVISPNGRWWALNVEQAGETWAGRLMLWDRKQNDGWHRFPEIRTATNRMAFTNDSKTLITLSVSGFLRAWQMDE